MSSNPDFTTLTKLLDEELWTRYNEEQALYDQHNKIEDNKTIAIAYLEEQPVGCACFKPVNIATVEIKRMYVLPNHRGKGIAMALLTELEQWAKQLSFQQAVLETGIKQPEAIALYKKAGYKIIENYGPYVGMDSSVCMGKAL